MVILFAIIAVYIAWIWVDYYRLIDIYDRDDLGHFILSFFLGGLSVLLVFGINKYLLDHFYFELNGEWLNDFLYTSFKIGAVEELSKLAAYGILFSMIRKSIDEPVDVLAFIATSALGFSAVENVLYFTTYGPSIIDGRAILSTVGHMFFTALIGYGILLNKYKYHGKRPWLVFGFFLLASLSHGTYNFVLMHEPLQNAGFALLLVFFFLGVEVFATMLNNALNNSSFFTYKKVINPNKVATRLLLYYMVLMVLQSMLLLIDQSFVDALLSFYGVLLSTGAIIFITCLRMSRFKLIKNRWNPLRLEFPFSISASTKTTTTFPMFFGLRITVNGESYDETLLNQYYHEYFILKPQSSRKSVLKRPKKAYIADKLFLYQDKNLLPDACLHDARE